MKSVFKDVKSLCYFLVQSFAEICAVIVLLNFIIKG